jgi:hypothetical protein
VEIAHSGIGPRYDLTTALNMAMNPNKTWIEADTFREAGIDYINITNREVLAGITCGKR